MLSAFNTKFKALKSRLPQSSLDSPWRMALFCMVATVVILTSFLLMIFGEVFKAMAHANDDSNDVLDEDNRPDANGYKSGDVYYSKPGAGLNPMLADLWEKSNETWYK